MIDKAHALELHARWRKGDSAALTELLFLCRESYGKQIAFRLGFSMERDDAVSESDAILLSLLRKFNPERNDNIGAFIGIQWKFAVDEIIGNKETPTMVELQEWDASVASAEDVALTGIEAREVRHFLASLFPSPVDLKAALTYFGDSAWKSGSAEEGPRESVSPGARAAEVYREELGITLTAKQASARVRGVIGKVQAALLAA